jgi:hypothetical protein
MTELSFHPNGHFARLSFAIASGSNNLKGFDCFTELNHDHGLR